MDSFYVTDKGRGYIDKLSSSDRDDTSEFLDLVILEALDRQDNIVTEGIFYDKNLNPKSEFAVKAKASFRRLFEAGYIDKE